MRGKLVILALTLVLLSTFLLIFEQYDVQSVSSAVCPDIPMEVLYVTVTVTITPLPQPLKEDDEDTSPSPIPDWETSYWCFHNPDYSDICIYNNLCFDGHNTLLFLDPNLPKDAQVPLFTKEYHPIKDENYEVFTVNEDSGEDRFIPFLGSTIELNGVKYSPRSKNIRKSKVIDDSNVYLAFQHNPEEFPADPYHFVKDNIMLWEVQRQNVSFSPFMSFPSIDMAMILRSSLPTSWENDIIGLVTQSHTNIMFWEDLEDQQISSSSPVCMKQAVIIGSKPQYFSGVSEGEAFKTRLYEYVNLPRPLDRGWDRESGFRPFVSIYNPQGEGKYHLHNTEQLVNLLNHYDLDFEFISDAKIIPRLRDYGKLFQRTDVLICPHDVFEVNFMWLGAHVSVIEIFPPLLLDNRYEIHSKSLLLNYQPIRSWIAPPAPKEIIIPLREMELAVIEAFDMQAVSIRNRATNLYINSNITFHENDWFSIVAN